MIRCLFIGGCKHSQVIEVAGSCISGPESKDIEKYLSPEPPISMWMLKFQSIIIDKISASLSMPREIIKPKKDE